MIESYIVIIGDQAETQQCYGPFADLDAAFAWTRAIEIDDSRVSAYQILAPDYYVEVK